MTCLKKYYYWSRKEKILFFKAIIYLFWARLLILLPAKNWYKYTLLKKALVTNKKENTKEVNIIHRSMIRAVKFSPWQTRCLVRSLAYKKMLEDAGIKSELKLGIKKGVNNELKAHAWLNNKLVSETFHNKNQYIIVN